MKRRFMKNNKGYSMVEMIICIAIIAILSGIALVTLSMINSAKAKDAAVSFNSVLADTMSKAKGQMCIVSGVEQPNYKRCMYLYLETSSGRYYVKTGYYDDATDQYYFENSENKNGGKGTNLSSKVIIKYENEAGTVKTVDSTGVYIVFNKNGTCSKGTGLYEFYNSNGSLVDEVRLKANGSHQLY